MSQRDHDIARKAAEKLTGTAYCQYGMHMAPVERMTVWRGANGLKKRICLTCKAKRK